MLDSNRGETTAGTGDRKRVLIGLYCIVRGIPVSWHLSFGGC